MEDRFHPVGGAAVRIGDCFIWAAIQYLDSPTDYRECLPSHRNPSGELIFLDDGRRWPRILGPLVAIAILACVLLPIVRACGWY